MKYSELRKIDVSPFVQQKGKLSYISWVYAVDQLQQLDESATWEYKFFDGRPYCAVGDTLLVFCTVKAFGRERTAFLPVMDHKNRAIANPDAFAVNTCMQRCLAKAIALHGIGISVYAGEDLPDAEPHGPLSDEEATELLAKIHTAAALDELKIAWGQARATAVERGDLGMAERFDRAKDARKAQLTQIKEAA